MWSVEDRKHLSNKRKEYLKNHPNEHPWKRNNKFKSKPCEHLKEILRKDFEFVEEYTDKRWQHNFSLDIAFLDKKLAIEVNGNQHYNNDGTLTEYYQKRHNYLESEGWLILEVHYAACYKEDKISEIKDAIVNCKNINLEEHKLLFENRQKTKKEKELEKEQKYKYAKENGLLKKNGNISWNGISTKEWNERREHLLNCGVDLTKFGWVKLAEEKTGYSKRIIEGILNHFKEEFEGKYFRRKLPNKM